MSENPVCATSHGVTWISLRLGGDGWEALLLLPQHRHTVYVSVVPSGRGAISVATDSMSGAWVQTHGGAELQQAD